MLIRILLANTPSTRGTLNEAREVLEGVNEYFAQIKNGEPTANSAEALFERTFYVLSRLDA